MTVDSHHHVWDPAARDYEWLRSAPQGLQRRFDIGEYLGASASSGVSGSVLVQALNSAEETTDLLAVASGNSTVTGVVGWADLTGPDVGAQLSALKSAPGGQYLVGIRHLVHDEADPLWLQRPDVIRGLGEVAKAGLVYDLLVRPRELPAALVAVDAVPAGRFVLDHGGKPEMASGRTEPWAELVGQLAKHPNVACKFSGLVTEAGSGWSEESIAPYAAYLIEHFGPGRLLFGSDWPVCTLAATYEEVYELALALLDRQLTPGEKQRVMAANATELYRLPMMTVPR
ncbi:MAG TPA: amidohydrolase family protein [Acidimicrobiales bacterium]|nr:amidohydrolase family protein [Acidimicrobiales bacterium]